MHTQKRGKGRGGKKIKHVQFVMRMLPVQCLPTTLTTTYNIKGYTCNKKKCKKFLAFLPESRFELPHSTEL